MSNVTNKVNKNKLIPAALVLSAIMVAGAFAIAPNTGQPTVDELPKKAILLGDVNKGVDGNGDGIVINKFRWSEDCGLTQTGTVFKVVMFECTQHTIVMRIIGEKGDRANFQIDNLLCSANDDDQAAIVRGNAGTGVLIDIIDAGTSAVDTIRLTDRPNEWVVNVNTCDASGTGASAENDFKFTVVLVDDGSFEFDFAIETL